MTSYAVPIAVATTIGFTEADQLISGHGFTMRPVIGGFILGIFLYAIDSMDSKLGTLFAALVVINAIVKHGNTVLGKLAQ